MALLFTIFHSSFVHSIALNKIEYIENGILVVNNKTGKIHAFFKNESKELEYQDFLSTLEKNSYRECFLGKSFLCPGFVDTHTHAPQYVFAGCGQIPLLEWLEKFTFPTEAKFSDCNFAREWLQKSVHRHLSYGSTTVSYFGTIHLEACRILCDIISAVGQRAFVGKTCMDRNSPSFYVEPSAADSVRDTAMFIEYVIAKNNPLITPIVTPRFVPTCTSELMSGLSELAQKYKLPIQTHHSENKGEIDWVRSLHPKSSSYADVYDQHHLLTNKTILGHSVHITQEEISLILSHETAISHCPGSNFALNSGILDVRQLLNMGVKIGLGSDVAGGYSCSILDVIRQALIGSRAIGFHRENYQCLSFEEVFYLATLGGARCMGLDETIGSFAVGKDFDALVIDSSYDNSPIDIVDSDTLKDIFQKFIFNGDDRNIVNIFVRGKEISLQNAKYKCDRIL